MTTPRRRGLNIKMRIKCEDQFSQQDLLRDLVPGPKIKSLNATFLKRRLLSIE
jgi:hypothetical protein